MWDKILPYLQLIGTPVLGAAGLWIAYIFQKQKNRQETRDKRRMEIEEIEHKRKVAIETLAAIKQNSLDSIAAVEQLFPNLPGPEKAKLAMERADQLNAILGVKPPSSVVTTYNEGGVLHLPPAPTTIKGEG